MHVFRRCCWTLCSDWNSRSMQKKTLNRIVDFRVCWKFMLLTHEDGWQSKLQEGYLVSNENRWILKNAVKLWILNAWCFVMHFSDYNIFTDEEWEDGQQQQYQETVVNCSDADRKWREKNNQQKCSMHCAISTPLYFSAVVHPNNAQFSQCLCMHFDHRHLRSENVWCISKEQPTNKTWNPKKRAATAYVLYKKKVCVVQKEILYVKKCWGSFDANVSGPKPNSSEWDHHFFHILCLHTTENNICSTQKQRRKKKHTTKQKVCVCLCEFLSIILPAHAREHNDITSILEQLTYERVMYRRKKSKQKQQQRH